MKINKPLEENQNVILELEGEIREKTVFTNQLRDLLAQGYRRFVIDLGKERKVDAAGLGALIVAWKTIRAAGGDMKLTRIYGRTRKVLRLTGLDAIFEIYDTPDQAMASFCISDGLRCNKGRETERRERACVQVLSEV